MSGLKPNTPEYIPLLELKCISLVTAGLMGSEVYVAETTDVASKIIGCAVWYGPGRTAGDSRLLFSLYDDDLMKWLPDVRSPISSTHQNIKNVPTPRWARARSSILGVSKLLAWTQNTIVKESEGYAVLKKAVLTNTPFVVECTSEITFQFCQSVGFKVMPVLKGGEERRQEFTSVKGKNFSL
ncbi:hypothetical protein C8J57DRAFT_1239199 [Mycena rebaudengoi]|nr:hypothetical protein C8J57DRAFT_1239199 [Mycena rebaudengoi]